MSSVLQKSCPAAVLQWEEKAEYWSRITKVPTALILAFIDQESGGNPKAVRYEEAYCLHYRSTPLGAAKLAEIRKETGIRDIEAVASYGLMQPLFTLAYGYGARSLEDLADPSKNIRFSTAHLVSLHLKFMQIDKHGWTSDLHIQKVAGAYNGAGENSKYAKDIVTLYHKYNSYLRKGV